MRSASYYQPARESLVKAVYNHKNVIGDISTYAKFFETGYEKSEELCFNRDIRDRIVQQAAEKEKKELFKNWCVANAHIHGYFDNIKHEILLGLLKRCISEKRY